MSRFQCEKEQSLRVMIVEDEPPMLRFLSRLLCQTEGFQVVSQCTGAEEALELLGTVPVDLLISDIRMSGMSGLQLAESARGLSPDLHIIIVTGYKSFEYAKTAVPLNIDAFVTKPVDQREFQEILFRIRRACQEGRLSKSRAALEQAFACNDQTQFGRLLAEQGCVPCQVMLVYYPGDHGELLAGVKRARDSLLYLHYQDALLFFLPEADSEETARYIAVKCSRQVLKPATGLCLRLSAFPDSVPLIGQLREIYRNQLLKMVIPGSFACYTVWELEERMGQAASYTKDHSLRQEMEREVLSRRWDGAWLLLERLFLLWEKDRMPVSFLRRRVHGLTELFARGEALTADPFSVNDQIDELMSVMNGYGDIREGVIRILKSHVIQEVSSDDKERELFLRIKALVLQSLGHNYTLQEICGIFQVSQPYVRKIFLKFTEKTYNDFILGEKINCAVRMLEENPRIPVKDLAAALGYEQLYFSKVFKKNLGITPSQYKESVSERSVPDQTKTDQTKKGGIL